MFYRKKEKKIPFKSKEGSSLVMVICISAFLMAFALAMIYTAGLLLSRSNQRLSQERKYQLARSFSLVLEQELKEHTDFHSAPEKSFYRYAVQFLEGQYGEYDPDYMNETIFHYTTSKNPMEEGGEHYGNIRIAMYKEAGEKADDLSGTISADTDTEKFFGHPIQRYLFTVEVTADTEEGSFCYFAQYQQMAVYDVHFTYEGRTVVKTDDGWHYDNAGGASCDFNDGTEIQYAYLTGLDHIKTCVFENAYGEEEKQP